jgi:diacylglycerol kinase family enzyme
MKSPSAPEHAATGTTPGGPPLIVVCNLGAGLARGDELRTILAQGCERAGRRLQLIEVSDPKQLPGLAARAVAQARQCGGVVVAAGGDGTINTVAQATLGSGCAFGVLPQGTFNYFSRAHGIPDDAAQALQVLLAGHCQPVQVGLVGTQIFLVNASLGLYPRLLEDREDWKRQFGRSRMVAFGAGLATLLRGHRSLRLRVQAAQGSERELRTPTLFVGNNALQMEQLGLPEADAIKTGHLVAIALRPVGVLKMLSLLMRGALGQLGEAEELIHVATRQFTVRASRRLGTAIGGRIKVATDGEVRWMRLPLNFRVAPQPLDLLCAPVVVTAVSAADRSAFPTASSSSTPSSTPSSTQSAPDPQPLAPQPDPA